jgi:hypothetical protein
MNDPITIGSIVATALATAGDAVIRNAVGEAVKDAYRALKAGVAQWASADVDALVKAPKSAARQAVVAEAIDALPDEERVTLQSLADRLIAQMRQDAAAIGADIAGVEKLEADLRKIVVAEGTGLRIRDVGDAKLTIDELIVGSPPGKI